MADKLLVKLEQEEMDQSEREKKVNSNAVAELAIANADVGGLKDSTNNNDGGHGGGVYFDGALWELEGIKEMETAAAEFLGGYGSNVGGGWGEWKHDDGGETWREWELYAANNYQLENDWVIDDLWVFDDDHRHQPNYNNGDRASANPRNPRP